jgi:hypothetical protein
MPLWLVIGLVLWIVVSVVVIAVCVATGRIDAGLGRRGPRSDGPVKPEPPRRPRTKVE